MRQLLIVSSFAFALVAAACSGGGGTGMPGPFPSSSPVPQSKIKHVIIIFQENRTVDNLFQGFPGADTASAGLNSGGQMVPLQPVNLANNYDLDHSHRGFTTEYDGGKMDGFDKVGSSPCTSCPSPSVRAYGYVPQAQVQPYWTMAAKYVLADRMFQTNQGPSFPAHQYIISGTSATSASSALLAAENPHSSMGASGGCDSPADALVTLIDPSTGVENQSMYPCLDHKTLFDSLDAAHVTWRYYEPYIGPGLWTAPDAIAHIRNGPDYANVSAPNTNVLSDIQGGRLAQVSWVIPTGAESDHAKSNDGSGPSWVASIINAVGASPYWNDTAIFVTWDDWGGWYDHVAPTLFNQYELGLRVPLLVVSPYSKHGYVSHVPHEFGSILKFVEETFGAPTVGYTDARSDDLADCFDFSQTPPPFATIQAQYRASYFAGRGLTTTQADSDF